ncbi:MAG TPA: diguanylate cyclase, partial [Polyangia bacterium]
MSGRVLILDGDTSRLGRLAHAVSEAGGEPFEVSSAAAAVRAAASCELVLLAGDEGLAALSAISAAHPMLPRISIVGPVGAGEAERLVEAIRGALVHHRPAQHDFETLTRDRLTGALAWHYFRMRLVEELDRAGRYSRALSLLLVDLDDLRGLNDRLGR